MGRLGNINKRTYLRLLRELRAIAKSVGFDLTLYRRPLKYSSGRANFGAVRGAAVLRSRKLIVTAYGHASRRKILHTVAHEVRHAIHYHNGIFPDYYRDDHDLMLDFLAGKSKTIPPGYKFCPQKIALMAERDCNKWATTFMRRNGLAPPNRLPGNGYSLSNTYTEIIKKEIRRVAPSVYFQLSFTQI